MKKEIEMSKTAETKFNTKEEREAFVALLNDSGFALVACDNQNPRYHAKGANGSYLGTFTITGALVMNKQLTQRYTANKTECDSELLNAVHDLLSMFGLTPTSATLSTKERTFEFTQTKHAQNVALSCAIRTGIEPMQQIVTAGETAAGKTAEQALWNKYDKPSATPETYIEYALAVYDMGLTPRKGRNGEFMSRAKYDNYVLSRADLLS